MLMYASAGNLPYKVTGEDVVAHFAEACGRFAQRLILKSLY